MLKKICRLFLGLVVCASSACVTPTHASSATMPPVIITKIQAASPVSAKDELIELFNTTANDIDLSGWCLVNKSSIKFACFTPKQEGTVILRPVLPANTYATIVSDDFLVHNTNLSASSVALTFAPTSQSSGSLVASSDTLALVDANNEVQSTWLWQAAVSSGKLLARQVVTEEPLIYAATGTASDWQLMGQSSVVRSNVLWVETIVIPDSEPEQEVSDDPPGEGGTSVDSPLDQSGVIEPLQITELLPNAVGSDIDNEFIEVYNPNLVAVSGANYKLLAGANLDKTYILDNFTVAPLSYVIIKNDVTKFSLSNTSGAVQLSLNGNRVGEPITYKNPAEGEAWALINGVWQYTNRPTPGAVNRTSEVSSNEGDEDRVVVAQKPCADNQYRNQSTGRCRLIATTSAARTPCKENQTRNVDTGRCRNNTVATTAAPCKTGQERNPETNRCRNITKMSKAGNELKIAEKTQKSAGAAWYAWLGIGGVILSVLSYGIWEWRQELQQVFQKMKKVFLKRSG